MLPDSMLNFIWDYGSLSDVEEATYIEKLIQTLNFTMQEDNALKSPEIKFISESVVRS